MRAVSVKAAQVPTVQVAAKDHAGVSEALERTPVTTSPGWTFEGVDRLAESVGVEIVIGNEVEAAEKSPEESATCSVNPDSEQASVGVPEIVAFVALKVKPGQGVPSVDEISVPLL